MGAQLRRTIAAVVALAGAVAGVLMIAAPAAADELACADSYRATGSYELFDVEERFVPPPLRGTGWDCASRTIDGEFSDEHPAQYTLAWVDITVDEALDVLARFQDAGWTTGDEMTIAENAAGRAENDRTGAAELRGWEPQPGYFGLRFGNRQTGDDIISLTFADGVVRESWFGLGARPVLAIEIITWEGAYGAATGASDPSALSGLQTVADAMPNSTQTAVLGGTAVFLTLLVGLPGFLVDTVLEKRWARLTAWMRARRPARSAPAPPGRVRRPAPRWLVWPGFAAASLIACFVDPSFGLNPMSVRLYLTMFASLTLVNVVGWFAASTVIRRLQPDARPRIVFRWGSLVLVAVAVVIGRLLQFEPGAVFGLVAGLTFAVSLAASRDALVILIGSGAALVLSLLAWVGYSLVAPAAEAAGGSVLLRGLAELFSGVVVEGISTLPLALLPLLALDGAVIFAWRRWVWALAYTGGAAAFVLVMLTLPDAWSEVSGDYLRWVAVFVGFAAFAVAIWGTDLFFERRKARRALTPAGVA